MWLFRRPRKSNDVQDGDEIMTYDQFTGVRWITVLTPGTFTRKMIVVSTVMGEDGDGKHGETSIASVGALNSFSIDFDKVKWKKIKAHDNLEKAKKFHDKYSRSRGLADSEKEK